MQHVSILSSSDVFACLSSFSTETLSPWQIICEHWCCLTWHHSLIVSCFFSVCRKTPKAKSLLHICVLTSALSDHSISILFLCLRPVYFFFVQTVTAETIWKYVDGRLAFNSAVFLLNLIWLTYFITYVLVLRPVSNLNKLNAHPHTTVCLHFIL